MHNQVLILMHRVVTAEQYTMARHALLLMPVEPPTRAFGDAMGRRIGLEQRHRAAPAAEPITGGSSGT
ncbi:MAG TPA: hypothetical protein VJ625_00140 [Propionibacteriaceae bacterium]|nr:hypothetical protein [Propionibacteriaceae bacterium]